MKKHSQPDIFLLSLIVILIIFGFVILSSASFSLAKIKFNDSFYYLKRQFIYGFLPGLLGFIIAYFFSYKNYKKLALFFILVNILFLILVKFTPLGITAGGSTRWIQLGPISFQPSELLKITYIIYIAAWLSNSKARRTSDIVYGLLPFLILSAIVGFLLYIQPSTSIIAILILSGFILYLIGGAKIKYILYVLILVGILASILFLFPDLGGYRFKRIFFDVSDIYGSAYHKYQSLLTIGSGGWLGFGFGRSTTKIKILPEPLGDSVFAVAAQELGFVGASAIIILLGGVVFRMFYLALKCQDKFGKLILAGFALIIGIQSLIHISVLIIERLPMTGIPLPFISYGGTSLAVFITMSGIALNISKNIN